MSDWHAIQCCRDFRPYRLKIFNAKAEYEDSPPAVNSLPKFFAYFASCIDRIYFYYAHARAEMPQRAKSLSIFSPLGFCAHFFECIELLPQYAHLRNWIWLRCTLFVKLIPRFLFQCGCGLLFIEVTYISNHWNNEHCYAQNPTVSLTFSLYNSLTHRHTHFSHTWPFIGGHS